MKDILIYGCYGYTGKLICELLRDSPYSIVLAGRDAAKVESMALQYGWEYHSFALEDDKTLNNVLSTVKMIIHCAGPFQHTAQPVIAACMKTGTHYTDITGEIKVFEYAASLSSKAAANNVMLLPGTGFDVVPSDCLSNWLHEKMPDADSLTLALYSPAGKLSHGTARTVVENIGEGGQIRTDGKLQNVPHGWHTREFDFGFTKRTGVTIPWGDLSTAYSSTGIKNIRVYNCAPKSVIRGMKLAAYTGFILSARPVQKILKNRLKKNVTGPSKEERDKGRSYIYGEVNNGNSKITALLDLPDGYSLTAATAVLIAEKIISGEFKVGYQTPATAYGADLITEIDTVERKIISQDQALA